MRYPVTDVRVGDMMLFRGIIHKVVATKETPDSVLPEDRHELSLLSFAAPDHIKEYRFPTDAVVLLLDRNCEEVTVL